ncbi:MAG: hypothetical protein IJZ29_01490 [Clostridia bacterium]|nr:hypothetical protein [Clostridia bacterium]
MSKLGNYLGLSRKANYLIIGSDNIKSYHKKMYLIILSAESSENVDKIAKSKAKEYNIKAIKFNEDLSKFIGLDGCKIVALKNKGLSDAILKCESEYSIVE